MAGKTLFSIDPKKGLVYSASGRKAPSKYFVKGSTVYKAADNAVGRVKVGTVSKKRSAKRPKKSTKTQVRRTKSRLQKAGETGAIIESLDDLLDQDFGDEKGEAEDSAVNAFAEAFKDAVNPKLPQWLQNRIRALDNKAIWQAYQANAFVFERYFEYNPEGNVRSADNFARWALSLVEKIEKMGVAE